MIKVQQNDFDIALEHQALFNSANTGAVVTFVGYVRDFKQNIKTFNIEHYPGMTEKALHAIESEALNRWPLHNAIIIHRVGQLNIDDKIVFVGVSSSHRNEAFDACRFIIDTLKTSAPFWKQEGDHWVEANPEDQKIAERWLK